jgi:hypothetical protein
MYLIINDARHQMFTSRIDLFGNRRVTRISNSFNSAISDQDVTFTDLALVYYLRVYNSDTHNSKDKPGGRH